MGTSPVLLLSLWLVKLPPPPPSQAGSTRPGRCKHLTSKHLRGLHPPTRAATTLSRHSDQRQDPRDHDPCINHLHFLLLIALHSRRHRTSRYRFAFAFSSAASDRILVFTAFAFLETQHVAILFRFRICFFQRCFRPHCFYRIALHHSRRYSTSRYPFAFAITFVSALLSAAFSFLSHCIFRRHSTLRKSALPLVFFLSHGFLLHWFHIAFWLCL